jgi:predicted peptidase
MNSDSIKELLEYEKSKEFEARMKVINDLVYEKDGKVLNFMTRVTGEKPETGYPLYIGMHGGGSCDAEGNDEQHDNHKAIYSNDVEDGSIWLAPRSAEDCWNM